MFCRLPRLQLLQNSRSQSLKAISGRVLYLELWSNLNGCTQTCSLNFSRYDALSTKHLHTHTHTELSASGGWWQGTPFCEVVEKLAAVWQQCWVTLCYQGWRRWQQNHKLQLAQGEQRLEKCWKIRNNEFFNKAFICILELQLSWRSMFFRVKRCCWRFFIEVHSTHTALSNNFLVSFSILKQ